MARCGGVVVAVRLRRCSFRDFGLLWCLASGCSLLDDAGRTLGHQDHVSPGAVRTLRCDPGLVLNGSSAWPDVSVICNSDGSWSDNGRTQCTRVPATGSPSTPPTRSPVNYEEVRLPVTDLATQTARTPR